MTETPANRRSRTSRRRNVVLTVVNAVGAVFLFCTTVFVGPASLQMWRSFDAYVPPVADFLVCSVSRFSYGLFFLALFVALVLKEKKLCKKTAHRVNVAVLLGGVAFFLFYMYWVAWPMSHRGDVVEF